ncbi:cancer-related nucleoside-triphosphatase homolog isoform X1 [Mus musculus]|uniref:cancer-related nucleoside-triphosphatase homolog isoform X1 n=1 Tax=Mus musculus TaxID=10090 RepID=UPI0005ABA524|nr:cancer-related nucleoside-triphosphatase homolog isoform X1 [Mus musculus]|eukprot:XP_006531346.2 PREDICTED: cancer-related nucleoside-triphosphatase homolog isoform X1 [Mus musculus]
MSRHVFLTGPPGVGKTTLIQKAIEVLQSSGLPVDGFYTQEVRQEGKRIGFDVVTLSGAQGPLSRAGSSCGPKHRVCIIDEIGKMELFSQPFIQAVRQMLSTPGIIVVGTIPVPKGKPLALVEEIRKRRDVKVFNVTRDNRNSLLPDIVAVVQSSRT